MYRQKTLQRAVTFYVMLIMIAATILTAACYVLLYEITLLIGAPLSTSFLTFWMPFIALVVSLIMGVAVSVPISNHYLKPLENLFEATKAVANGDFTVRADKGNANGVFADYIDSFNKMTEALGSLEFFRSDFINTFSHEFKTPVVSIRGFAKLLKNPDLTEEQKSRYADTIIQESERLASMAANVLLLSQYENTNIISEKETFSLDEQIRECISLMEREWLRKNITMTGDLERVDYYGNEDIMSHLWVNLLSNAVKFTPEGGTVSVSLASDGRTITATVSDSGIGMDEQAQKHIYEKFYQCDASHRGNGNGLGLSIVKRIVDLCCGDIAVESAKGEGTRFTVRLPAERE